MTKRLTAKSLTLIMILCLSGVYLCAYTEEPAYQEIGIHPYAEAVLEQFSLESSTIKSVYDYSRVEYFLTVPEIDINEVVEYINDKKILSSNALKAHMYDSIINYSETIFRLALYRLSEQKKVQMIISVREEVIQLLIDGSEFELNKYEIAEYSLEIVHYYESLAYLYDLSLEEYCNEVLKISYNDFFDMCYLEGEILVKTYLIVGAVSYMEFQDELVQQNINEENIYENYMDLENRFYELFIFANPDF